MTRARTVAAHLRVVVAVAAAVVSVALIPGWPSAAQASGVTWWTPAPQTTWQWQLTGPVDTGVNAQMYDVDLFDTSADLVDVLHRQGRVVVCYLSAGSYENWRPDAAEFPPSVLGSPLEGWPGERWLDIRQLDTLAPIMQQRLDLCQLKGFDGVELDNVDGYTNASGFPLGAADQRAYNLWLAGQAHQRGLSVGLKNDLDQVPDLVGSFDWALNEQCFEYEECELLELFIQANKAVFEVEYNLSPASFCEQANALRFSAIKKNAGLDAARISCR
jgi:hypothetical protein